MEIQMRDIASLMPDPSNVREHDQRNADAIKASLARFGQQKPIVVDADGVVIAGNGTLGAAKALGWEQIAVVETDLQNAEAVAYAIADNRTAELANWDDQALALVLDQFDSDQLEASGFLQSELDDLINSLDPLDEDEQYTAKVESPHYEPSGQKPDLQDVYDPSKANALIAEIEKLDCEADIKAFLLAAATRFNSFNYQNVAELYAHADAPIQRMMEKLALVIIDFKDAIANGFVRVNEELLAQYDDEYGAETEA